MDKRAMGLGRVFSFRVGDAGRVVGEVHKHAWGERRESSWVTVAREEGAGCLRGD